MALMKRNVPLNLLLILEKWFCISVTCVKWINVFSETFSLRAGERQGGILSPIFLQFFYIVLLTKLSHQTLDVVCAMSMYYCLC